MKKTPSYAVYFAGELFSANHLIGNAYLAEAIFEKSHGRFQCVLPQNIEHRSLSAQSVRDRNLRTLAACDLALFNFDGPELDAGTVVEFMFAKFADIPAVLIELGYLSNTQDEAEMATNAWRKNVAEAVAKAIDKHFAGDAPAPQRQAAAP